MLEQPVPEVLHPVGRTHAEQVVKKFGAVCEGLSPLGGAPPWSRGSVRRKAQQAHM